jgi:hypothetical protein
MSTPRHPLVEILVGVGTRAAAAATDVVLEEVQDAAEKVSKVIGGARTRVKTRARTKPIEAVDADFEEEPKKR